ncbi:hypothetical protein SLS62_008011 [Diatrype stigma]|uniref:Cytochrome P450 alkane hydroxylase n=1 Tax=Diatrype stigma TaxID=117547 RepID=A0AAN9YQ53_9PEZI
MDVPNPPVIDNQRPLGIDRLEQIFRANAKSRLMELFLFHFHQTGYTLKQVFLGTPAYGTVDPANMETILSSKFTDWGNGPRRAIAFPMFGDGIFTQDGQAWKHSRDILRPQFAHRQYETLGVFKEPLADLLGVLPDKEGLGGVVDLQSLFFSYTLDVTTAFLFGDSVRSLRSSGSSAEPTFARAFDLAQIYVAKRFRLSGMYFLIGGKEFREACREVHQFADRIIDQNLSREPTDADEAKYVFLKSVAKSCPDRAALRGQIINILAAGRDTTACMLSWLFSPSLSFCARQYKDRSEDNSPSHGWRLRQEVAHAEVFRPERWDEDLPLNQDPTLQKWGYLPFNGGPRVCLGIDFALTEVAYTVVTLLQRYPVIKLPDGERVDVVGAEKQSMTLVIQITGGCKVELG